MTLKFFLVSAAASAFTFACAQAEPVAVGKFKDWSVFTDGTGKDTVCYAATPAKTKSPKSANHGDVWFYVTAFKSGGGNGQPSVRVGYDLDEARDHAVKVGRSTWALFSSGRESFADDADDPKIVAAIKKGASLKVEARSARGTNTAYEFSLSGSSAAIEKAAAGCK